MSTQTSQFNRTSNLILRTGIFNDEQFFSNSLEINLTDNTVVIDISNDLIANFTESDWDRILDSILSSEKVITV